MLKEVWKFPLSGVEGQTIDAPEGAEFLSVQLQGEAPVVWALVDPKRGTVGRKLISISTGDPIAAASLGRFLGTYQLHGGNRVWHVFEAAAV